MTPKMSDVIGHITFGTDVVIIFEKFHVTTVQGLVLACFIVFLLTLLFDVLKIIQIRHSKMAADDSGQQARPVYGEKTGVLEKLPIGKRLKFLSGNNMVRGLFHFLRRLVAYSLTLVIVTYNGWLILSVLSGVAIGYAAVLWKKRSGEDGDESDDE